METIDPSLIFQLAGIGVITYAAENFLVSAGMQQYANGAKIAGGVVCTLMIVDKAVELFNRISVFARW